MRSKPKITTINVVAFELSPEEVEEAILAYAEKQIPELKARTSVRLTGTVLKGTNKAKVEGRVGAVKVEAQCKAKDDAAAPAAPEAGAQA